MQVDPNFKLGRSGCSLSLKDGEITKRASNINYNDRLLAQYIKQKQFTSLHFKTPKTYNFYDSTNECASFSMEYISGKNFYDFCIDSSVRQINEFIDTVINYLKLNLQDSFSTKIDSSEFLQKEIFLSQYLEKNFKFTTPPSVLPIGRNHGDFSVSNMIFSDSYYLVDFLDNIFDTPINDIVKLRQDSKHKFYFTLSQKFNIKVDSVLDKIDKEVNLNFKDIVQSDEFRYLSILNLARILPYSKSEEETNAILKAVNELNTTSSG
jgi:hypothetical protein